MKENQNDEGEKAEAVPVPVTADNLSNGITTTATTKIVEIMKTINHASTIITICKALEFMTVFSTEMTGIISGFDAKMTKMTHSVIKLELNNTRYYQASIGQPCYQSRRTANNDTGPSYVSY